MESPVMKRIKRQALEAKIQHFKDSIAAGFQLPYSTECLALAEKQLAKLNKTR
jgi:hypothetical protein